MTDNIPTQDGWVYGHKLQEPRPPGDMEAMFDVAGVPDRLTSGVLPFSPEWYAGAKERQRLRDIEREELLGKRRGVGREWSELIWTDLGTWTERINFLVEQPEPLADLQVLLARMKHERPDDVERFKRLEEVATKAENRQILVRGDLSNTLTKNVDLESKIRAKETEDDAAEAERIEQKRIQEKRRRRGERALKRNEALLRGEEPPPIIEDSDAEVEAPTESASLVSSPMQTATACRPSSGCGLHSAGGSPAASVSPSPPLQRGGMFRELPPIQDPTRPPTG